MGKRGSGRGPWRGDHQQPPQGAVVFAGTAADLPCGEEPSCFRRFPLTWWAHLSLPPPPCGQTGLPGNGRHAARALGVQSPHLVRALATRPCSGQREATSELQLAKRRPSHVTLPEAASGVSPGGCPAPGLRSLLPASLGGMEEAERCSATHPRPLGEQGSRGMC